MGPAKQASRLGKSERGWLGDRNLGNTSIPSQNPAQIDSPLLGAEVLWACISLLLDGNARPCAVASSAGLSPQTSSCWRTGAPKPSTSRRPYLYDSTPCELRSICSINLRTAYLLSLVFERLTRLRADVFHHDRAIRLAHEERLGPDLLQKPQSRQEGQRLCGELSQEQR